MFPIRIFVSRHVQKRKLKPDGTIKEIKKIAPALENCGFIFILVQLIIDILKLNGFRVEMIRHTTNPIRKDTLKGNTVLCGFLFFIRPICLGDGGLNLFALGMCELPVGGQYGIPPDLRIPAVVKRHRSCL